MALTPASRTSVVSVFAVLEHRRVGRTPHWRRKVIVIADNTRNEHKLRVPHKRKKRTKVWNFGSL
jgi:hypothetical protein